MKVEKLELENQNPFLIRFRPDYRYVSNKKTLYNLSTSNGGFNSKDESITDREAYAINFASERGDIASVGASRNGVYSMKPGEKYDPKNDFSYLNRPDLTLVDLDNYIEDFKYRLENSDEQLKQKLTEELKNLQDKRDELINQTDNSDKNSSN